LQQSNIKASNVHINSQHSPPWGSGVRPVRDHGTALIEGQMVGAFFFYSNVAAMRLFVIMLCLHHAFCHPEGTEGNRDSIAGESVTIFLLNINL